MPLAWPTVLLVDETAEDREPEPAEAPGVQRLRAPDVSVTLSSPVVSSPADVRAVDQPRLVLPADVAPSADRGSGGLRSCVRVVGRLLGVATVLLAALTLAPFGRPDTSSIVAGGPTQQSDGAVDPLESVPSSTTTSIDPIEVAQAVRGPEPLQIDIAQIALAVDPELLGFELEPGTWVEPRIEPETEWIDGGNGVALPDLLLRIRYCESTNNYSAAHVASSARGAYQFLSKSWEWYGHAERYGVAEAHLATPAQQDEAALLTYRQVGARPWAESRHCWDDRDIDDRYLTAGPPRTTAPAPTMAPSTTSPSETTPTTVPEPTTTTEPTSTSDVTTATSPSTTAG